MERIWLQHYAPGVPHDIDTSRYSSLVNLLEDSFQTYRDRTAFIGMDKAITYGDLDDYSRALACYLQGLGLKRGARVALMMPNALPYPIAIAAVLRAGFVVVNVNPLYTPRELAFQLSDSGAEAIIVLENFASTVQAALAQSPLKHIIITSLGDLHGALKGTLINFVVRHIKKLVPSYKLPQAVRFGDALSKGTRLTLRKPQLEPDDLACLQYTGGTTGVAKGAMLLHRNLVANALQIETWLKPGLDAKPLDRPMVIAVALPLYHIFAFTACFLLGVRTGSTGILYPNPRDLPNVIELLKKYPVHFLPAVNTLFNALLNHPDFPTINWSALRLSVGGGMAVQKAVADKWYAATRCPIAEGYGLSETSPVLTCNGALTPEWTGTIGLPVPSTDISIRDDDGNEVALGEAGEICARGPQVMAGYWHRPDETARVMTADGFFRTGDIGIMSDDGRVKIVDRKKDMISVSGFKVFPNEVEDVIARHPGVMECAVVGVPDEHSGEAVKAFVVRKDPNLTEAELRTFCASELTGYKVPKQIEFRSDLPKTNVGKILRRALRDDTPNATAA